MGIKVHHCCHYKSVLFRDCNLGCKKLFKPKLVDYAGLCESSIKLFFTQVST